MSQSDITPSALENIMIEDINMWSSKLFASQYPLHEQQQQALSDRIYQLKAQQQSNVDSEVAVFAKHALFESQLNLLEDSDDSLQQLKHFIEELVALTASVVNEGLWPDDKNAKASIIESWYHITENGGYHDTHSHPNCSWCGIYYLKEGECNLEGRNGVNRFYDPRNCADHYQDAGTAYLADNGFIDFSPQAGQLIIFPSYLKHAAMPYFGKQDRVVIAFNCRVDLV